MSSHRCNRHRHSHNRPETLIGRVLRKPMNVLWEAPRLSGTGRLPFRTAAFMILAALPAIICALFTTVPEFLFYTPQHQAYFYFGRDLAENPISLLPMVVASACALLAMAMPFATAHPARSDRQG